MSPLGTCRLVAGFCRCTSDDRAAKQQHFHEEIAQKVSRSSNECGQLQPVTSALVPGRLEGLGLPPFQ